MAIASVFIFDQANRYDTSQGDGEAAEDIKREYKMITDKTEIGPREFLRVDVLIQSPDISPHEIKVIGPDGKKYASIIAMTDNQHGRTFQSTKNTPRGDYQIQLWHNDQNVLVNPLG